MYLVSHKSQLPFANSNHAAVQRRISTEGVALGLMKDVESCMSLTHMVLQRFLVSKPSIIYMFSEEFCSFAMRTTRQESLTQMLCTIKNDFEVITDVFHVLFPFKVA